MTKVKKINGTTIRCVYLQLNENVDKDGFEKVDEYEQEELPFK